MKLTDTKAKTVFLDALTIPEHLKIHFEEARIDYQAYPTSSSEEVLKRCQDAHTVITNKVMMTSDILEECKNLKHIAVAATGYNNVDIETCDKLGIVVSNVPDYASLSVAEHILSCTMVLRRNLIASRNRVLEGAWHESPVFCLFDRPISQLREATFGVIGYGNLGAATADLAHRIGMKVQVSSPNTKQSRFPQVDLEHLLETSDVVSVHCSLNEQTKNLIAADELSLMHASAILINTARGGIVDEDALAEALLKGEIAGAAIDVLAQEPPGAPSKLLQMANQDNLIITPHIAWAEDMTIAQLVDVVQANVLNFVEGNPQNIVNKAL